MNKNYKSPELEVKSFAIKESILAGEINTSWGDDWDTEESEDTSSTEGQG